MCNAARDDTPDRAACNAAGGKSLLRAACSARIVRSALAVSAVVGTILNLINQGEALLAGASVSWFHLSLNYAVPYLVASYSAARNRPNSSLQ